MGRAEMAHQHASNTERMGLQERAMQNAAVEHADELKASCSALDSHFRALQERVAVYEDGHTTLKVGHQDLQASVGSHHASFAERLASMERVIGDSVDKHSRALDSL